MTRKFFIFILSMLLAVSLTACANQKETDVSGGQNSNSEAPTDGYSVGDIVLADGSVVKAEALTAINSDNPPVAVMAGFKDNGVAFAVGVHRSDSPLPWAADNTAGYSTKFADTVCTQNTDKTFSGDTDGSDNWSRICAADGDGTIDAEKNYPAFHFVNTYGSDWYLPSIAELCTVYENRETINTALENIYDLDHSAAMDGLTTNWYWSSSQANSEDDYAWFVHFFNGYAGECPKNFTNVHVIAVRDF